MQRKATLRSTDINTAFNSLYEPASHQQQRHHQPQPQLSSHKRQWVDVGALESERSKPLKSRSYKYHLEDVRIMEFKIPNLIETIEFIPLLEFLSKNPITKKFYFQSGVTSIVDETIKNTKIGE